MDMGATLAHIYRHPIKAHGREPLDAVTLTAGQCLPYDRHWAIAHEGAKLMPGWNACMNFNRGAKNIALQAIGAALDEATGALTLTHPALSPLSVNPDTPDGQAALLAWLGPLQEAGRAAPARVVKAGRGMTDSAFPSVAVLNLASLRALSDHAGLDLGMDRWRGNLWLEGLAPWAEFDLIGRELVIGDARLRVVERIGRCRATMVDCATGKIDVNTLDLLEARYGHTDFGVYAEVVTGGDIALGAPVQVMA
jgi:uncharacterized protein